MNTSNVGEKILAEHKHLRTLLRESEGHLEQPADSAAWLEGLREMLSGLIAVCSEHFELEEQNGMHVQLRDQSPRLAHRLKELLSDHARLLEALQQLVADLPTRTVAPNEAGPLKDRVLGVLGELREHERAENEVMMDAYWDDLGGEAG